MKTQKISPDKIFRVDKKIVFKSTLPWAIVMSVFLLLFMHDFKILTTLADKQFWLFILIMWAVKLGIMDLWSILYERTEFSGSTITNRLDRATSANIMDFVSVKQKKTIYTNYLGFDYKEPKGIYVRYLLSYGHYNPETLKAIMQEILRINPNIKLEDDLSRQILEGTYKSKTLG